MRNNLFYFIASKQTICFMTTEITTILQKLPLYLPLGLVVLVPGVALLLFGSGSPRKLGEWLVKLAVALYALAYALLLLSILGFYLTTIF